MTSAFSVRFAMLATVLAIVVIAATSPSVGASSTDVTLCRTKYNATRSKMLTCIDLANESVQCCANIVTKTDCCFKRLGVHKQGYFFVVSMFMAFVAFAFLLSVCLGLQPGNCPCPFCCRPSSPRPYFPPGYLARFLNRNENEISFTIAPSRAAAAAAAAANNNNNNNNRPPPSYQEIFGDSGPAVPSAPIFEPSPVVVACQPLRLTPSGVLAPTTPTELPPAYESVFRQPLTAAAGGGGGAHHSV